MFFDEFDIQEPEFPMPDEAYIAMLPAIKTAAWCYCRSIQY
ncbi:hypothetical protein LMG28138_04953 [Pararobbsia alpina]|uniref:Uncharacterized protein n=1 Tax=Pararobbsia alpina TaxID=621374 RepID=A0A6S7DBR8_9BURK|nr:hypothetical protein LMG28138_04953 [Pararobbsia alpina]